MAKWLKNLEVKGWIISAISDSSLELLQEKTIYIIMIICCMLCLLKGKMKKDAPLEKFENILRNGNYSLHRV